MLAAARALPCCPRHRHPLLLRHSHAVKSCREIPILVVAHRVLYPFGVFPPISLCCASFHVPCVSFIHFSCFFLVILPFVFTREVISFFEIAVFHFFVYGCEVFLFRPRRVGRGLVR
jgi:hypothetical protein